jgi:hypothetical protein
MASLFEKIFPVLNAPEYINSPEVIISSVMWYELNKNLDPVEINGEKYRRNVAFSLSEKKKKHLRSDDGTQETQHPGKVKYVITHTVPKRDMGSETYEIWKNELESKLKENNFVYNKTASFSEAVFDSLEGIIAPKSVGSSSIPFSLGTALLQDQVGGLKKPSPFNLPGSLNKIYCFGNLKADQPRASELLFNEVKKPYENQPILNIISDSVLNGITPLKKLDIDKDSLEPSGKPTDPEVIPKWLDKLDKRKEESINGSNPFLWFYESWNRLLDKNNNYKSKLSARRYTDWIQCIARTGLIFSHLWCDLFYIKTADGLKNIINESDENKHEQLLEKLEKTLYSLNLFEYFTWKSSGLKPIDIKIKYKEFARDGLLKRKAIENLTKEMEGEGILINNDEDGLKNWLKKAKDYLIKHGSAKDNFNFTLNNTDTPSGLSNRVFFYRYSIRCREKIGMNSDLYYVGEEDNNHWLYINPSAEWLVVISQLSKDKVNDKTRLKDVMQSIKLLGINASKSIVSKKLEQIGLCTLKEDADEGLEIFNGF